MVEKLENVPLGAHTTFGIGGTARHFLCVTDEPSLREAALFAKQSGLPLVILGEGSNSIFRDGEIDAVVAKIELPGFTITEDDDTLATITVGAGERWDDVVERSVSLGLAGIEAMSAIPGTAGATPFQNVGAYGQEIKDTLVSLRAYDTSEDTFVEFANTECKFGYRDSIFRSGEPGRYIITSITLRLSKAALKMPDYPGVKKHFEAKGIVNPTLREIRDAIIEIRASKLPDPKCIKNAGSFFKNPIVDTTIAEGLKDKYPVIVMFPGGEGKTKLSAGWLIEHAGLKGSSIGPIKVYEHNALVLTNVGNATCDELEYAATEIIKKVKEKFGVILEQEPVFIG